MEVCASAIVLNAPMSSLPRLGLRRFPWPAPPAEAFSPRDVYTTEKALASAMTYDLDRYTLVSRAYEGWDSILTVLLALSLNLSLIHI